MFLKSWLSLVQFTLPENRVNWAKGNHSSETILLTCTSLIRMWRHLVTGNQRFFLKQRHFLNHTDFFHSLLWFILVVAFLPHSLRSYCRWYLQALFSKHWRFFYHMHKRFFFKFVIGSYVQKFGTKNKLRQINLQLLQQLPLLCNDV